MPDETPHDHYPGCAHRTAAIEQGKATGHCLLTCCRCVTCGELLEWDHKQKKWVTWTWD